ncbi:hypothetical protein ABZ923_35355 [Streptomyces sp. NPDC046881]|uniref:hypothetical protein n=1 Tax=Streptomyces sp. NPDC046881 TaxID=3155374 RepID=UPI0033E921E6
MDHQPRCPRQPVADHTRHSPPGSAVTRDAVATLALVVVTSSLVSLLLLVVT